MKKIAIAVLMLLLFSLPAHAEAPYLRDEENLIGAFKSAELEETLAEFSEAHGMNITIATVDSLDGYSAERYAERYYDRYYSGDGVILLLAMEKRDWAIYSEGNAVDAFTDDALDLIEDEILPLLKKDRYVDAFNRYAVLAEDMIARYEAGEPYEKPFPLWMALAIALGAGLVVALIVVFSMQSQLKSVRRRAGAAEYTKPGSMHLMQQSDMFLYSTVTRTPRPKSNSSGGGGGGGSRSGKF